MVDAIDSRVNSRLPIIFDPLRPAMGPLGNRGEPCERGHRVSTSWRRNLSHELNMVKKMFTLQSNDTT